MQYQLYSPQQARRHDVKPGFSGWAQINGRNATPEKSYGWMSYVDRRFPLIYALLRFEGLKKRWRALPGLPMPKFTGNR